MANVFMMKRLRVIKLYVIVVFTIYMVSLYIFNTLECLKFDEDINHCEYYYFSTIKLDLFSLFKCALINFRQELIYNKNNLTMLPRVRIIRWRVVFIEKALYTYNTRGKLISRARRSSKYLIWSDKRPSNVPHLRAELLYSVIAVVVVLR